MRTTILGLLALAITLGSTPATAAAPVTRAPKTATKLPRLSGKLAPATLSKHPLSTGIASSASAKALFEVDDRPTVSARQLADGPAWMTAWNALILPVSLPQFGPRGIHLNHDGGLVLGLSREWIGSHDVIVDCRGELPAMFYTFFGVIDGNKASETPPLQVTSAKGHVKFLVMTSALPSGDWVYIQLSDVDMNERWRVTSCSFELE
jgi:hypothetical protein